MRLSRASVTQHFQLVGPAGPWLKLPGSPGAFLHGFNDAADLLGVADQCVRDSGLFKSLGQTVGGFHAGGENDKVKGTEILGDVSGRNQDAVVLDDQRNGHNR